MNSFFLAHGESSDLGFCLEINLLSKWQMLMPSFSSGKNEKRSSHQDDESVNE